LGAVTTSAFSADEGTTGALGEPPAEAPFPAGEAVPEALLAPPFAPGAAPDPPPDEWVALSARAEVFAASADGAKLAGEGEPPNVKEPLEPPPCVSAPDGPVPPEPAPPPLPPPPPSPTPLPPPPPPPPPDDSPDPLGGKGGCRFCASPASLAPSASSNGEDNTSNWKPPRSDRGGDASTVKAESAPESLWVRAASLALPDATSKESLCVRSVFNPANPRPITRSGA
jgi:hypothetical protein